ncbi:MAG: AAA family ATPase [Candidatus Omnitrophica bacterium CG1_02_49_16]|nr:MAG: AAA family ATPase [Candidatus Omnitrophica bacterium CG1_02_49_16]
MHPTKIKTILKKGEGIAVEFKECKTSLSKEIFGTVCAFLNKNGGELFLGVTNNGEIAGIDTRSIEQIKKDFVTAVNNPEKISPAFYLTIEEIAIAGKSILYIYVPESSQVHHCSGKIFDRNEDGDFNITGNTNLVTAMYLRKQTTYSENKVYPFVKMTDLRADLIARARKLAVLQKPNHSWAEMTDVELVKSSQLYLKDYQSDKEGLTLAAILLLGRDKVILSVLPHFRTDAILRKKNVDLYDDRDDIRTNLLESYDRLMAFAAKHLPDKFYIENGQRISLRDHIFREIIVNLLIHREFINPFPAKLVIEKDRIYTENSNKPHGHGLIDPSNFSPFPKNPVISRFFRQMGLAEELGSGVRKLSKFGKSYFGSEPQFFEKDVFKMVASTNKIDTAQVTAQVTAQAEREIELLDFCKIPKSTSEMMKFLRLKHREHFRLEILNPLVDKGLLLQTIPEKPNSSKQKYRSTASTFPR